VTILGVPGSQYGSDGLWAFVWAWVTDRQTRLFYMYRLIRLINWIIDWLIYLFIQMITRNAEIQKKIDANLPLLRPTPHTRIDCIGWTLSTLRSCGSIKVTFSSSNSRYKLLPCTQRQPTTPSYFQSCWFKSTKWLTLTLTVAGKPSVSVCSRPSCCGRWVRYLIFHWLGRGNSGVTAAIAGAAFALLGLLTANIMKNNCETKMY